MVAKFLDPDNREFKQQKRRRLRKRHLKCEFALLQTLSRLFHLVQFVKCWYILLELNSKRLYQSSGKEKQSRCLVFTSSTKREIRHFHVVVVQRRQRNVQKSVMHVQSLCFAYLHLLLFCRSRCRHRRRCLSSLMFLDRDVKCWKKSMGFRFVPECNHAQESHTCIFFLPYLQNRGLLRSRNIATMAT